MATETKLQRVMYLLWHMTDDDAETLRRDLQRQMTRSFQGELTRQARAFGCPTARGNAPRGRDLEHLRTISKRDAESITRTYNRELLNQIARIYRESPRLNRYGWARRLQQWSDRRAAWKSQQIALNTELALKHYTQMRFYEENGIKTGFRFAGPPPVCKQCSQLFAKGTVTLAFVEKAPAPVHVSCPHFWKAVNPTPKTIPCNRIWLGD